MFKAKIMLFVKKDRHSVYRVSKNEEFFPFAASIKCSTDEF